MKKYKTKNIVMHDPLTVAFEIKNPFRSKKNEYSSIVTIWHRDPEKDGSDDSCGYTFYRLTESDRAYVKKIAKEQYEQLYARSVALREEKSYAYICYNQDVFGSIYWLWRVFNKGKERWQYGKELSFQEFQHIYKLSTNPVDNFQSHKINNLLDFEEFTKLIFRCYKTYKRKWYQRPKWHIHHWRLQIHFFEQLKRKYWDKCCICGKRGFKSSAYGNWEGNKIWHQECDNTRKPPL